MKLVVWELNVGRPLSRSSWSRWQPDADWRARAGLRHLLVACDSLGGEGKEEEEIGNMEHNSWLNDSKAGDGRIPKLYSVNNSTWLIYSGQPYSIAISLCVLAPSRHWMYSRRECSTMFGRISNKRIDSPQQKTLKWNNEAIGRKKLSCSATLKKATNSLEINYMYRTIDSSFLKESFLIHDTNFKSCFVYISTSIWQVQYLKIHQDERQMQSTVDSWWRTWHFTLITSRFLQRRSLVVCSLSGISTRVGRPASTASSPPGLPGGWSRHYENQQLPDDPRLSPQVYTRFIGGTTTIRRGNQFNYLDVQLIFICLCPFFFLSCYRKNRWISCVTRSELLVTLVESIGNPLKAKVISSYK